MNDHAAEARRLLALIDGHAASADSLAAIATTHALLAIADRLDRLTPTATAIHFDTQPAPDTLNTEPGWTAPTTGTYQLSTGQEPRPICGAPNLTPLGTTSPRPATIVAERGNPRVGEWRT